MAIVLKTLSATVFKRKPIQSALLPDGERQPMEAGRDLEVHSFVVERDHIRVAFSKD